jgi:hypothetical protein
MTRQLAKFEVRWAEAALGAIFPGESEEGLAGISGMDVRGFLGDVLRRLPLKAAVGLRLAIWLVALAPLFVLGRLATIARLGVADRERVVGVLVASRSYGVRSLVLILKTMGALLYAGDEAVRTRMLRVDRRPESSGKLVALRLRRAHAV